VNEDEKGGYRTVAAIAKVIPRDIGVFIGGRAHANTRKKDLGPNKPKCPHCDPMQAFVDHDPVPFKCSCVVTGITTADRWIHFKLRARFANQKNMLRHKELRIAHRSV
jgi:hypothetical protein